MHVPTPSNLAALTCDKMLILLDSGCLYDIAIKLEWWAMLDDLQGKYSSASRQSQSKQKKNGYAERGATSSMKQARLNKGQIAFEMF